MSRRRALIGGSAETPSGPTKLTEGEYTRGNSAWSVDASGKVTMTNWGQGAANGLLIPLDRAISINAGDEIAFNLLRKSGNPSWHGTDVDFYRSSTQFLMNMGSNMTWNWSNNTNSVSKTSTVTGNVTHIYLNNRGNAVASSANYSFALKITINGEVVLE